MPLFSVKLVDEEYRNIARLVHRRYGLLYSDNNIKDLITTVNRRIEKLDVGLRHYANKLVLGDGGDELGKLASLLAVGETYFFRNQPQFNALRNLIIPALVERKSSTRNIRIWSAGCSTGEEPYSIAITLKECIPEIERWSITLLATDINNESLDAARRGVYGDWSFRKINEYYRDKYFAEIEGGWAVDKSIVGMVKFDYFNLIADRFPDKSVGFCDFDIVFCRNVMIYFDDESIDELKNKFLESLAARGWFIVGHSESFYFSDKYELVNFPGAIIYRKGEEVIPAVAKPTSTRVGDVNVKGSFKQAGVPLSEIPPLANAKAISLADALIAEGNPNAAHSVLLHAEDGDAPDVLWRLGKLEAVRGNYDKGVELCEASLESDTLNPVGYFELARIYEEMGDKSAVFDNLRKALFVDREFAMGHFYLGDFFSWNNQVTEARKSYENALKTLSGYEDRRMISGGDGLTAGELRRILDNLLFEGITDG
ncbi:MAG: hypothetical protein GY771_00390 [bacterium]|nr:hypothetical protein [bacterium]